MSPFPHLLQFHTTDGKLLRSWNGFRALGYNFLICLFAVAVIHPGFSWITWGTIIPDPFFRLKIKNMQK